MNIVIVGGGIVGTAIASRLGTTDHDVVLVERSRIGCETTAASAGVVLQTAIDPDPFDSRLRARARSVYRELFEREQLESERIGTLYVAETAAFADRLAASAKTLQEYGVEASFVEAADLSSHGVDPAEFTGGLYTPGDSVCDPAAVAEWFADCARRAGAEVQTGVSVTDVRTTQGAVSGVVTDAGAIDADYVVNATGPWAPHLNELAGISLPLCHTQGPMAELEVEGSDAIEGPMTILESKQYVRPVTGIGSDSGSDSGGRRAWIGEYQTAYVDGQQYDPTALSVSDEFVERAIEMRSVVPALEDASVVDTWIGLRTVTPDGRPIVGETSLGGYVVACGMTGLGITLAPAIADVVSAVIDGQPDPASRDRLSPDRF